MRSIGCHGQSRSRRRQNRKDRLQPVSKSRCRCGQVPGAVVQWVGRAGRHSPRRCALQLSPCTVLRISRPGCGSDEGRRRSVISVAVLVAAAGADAALCTFAAPTGVSVTLLEGAFVRVARTLTTWHWRRNRRVCFATVLCCPSCRSMPQHRSVVRAGGCSQRTAYCRDGAGFNQSLQVL